MVARRGDAQAKMGQHQIGGGSAGMRGPNGTTPNRWIGGECAGKRRDCGTTMGCAGRTKRMWRGDEIRRPNKKNKARRWMHRPNKKRRRADGMRRPNK
jgi:hypothetical protein